MPELSPRRQTLDIYRSGEFMTLPTPPEGCLPLSEEALQFVEDIRKPRFAALAGAIDKVLDLTLARDDSTLVQLPKLGTPWGQFRAEVQASMQEDINAIGHTEEFKIAEAYTRLVYYLRSGGTDSLAGDFGQLVFGAGTSTTTMIEALRHTPTLVVALAGEGLHYPDVARKSVALVSRLAMTSVNQMMGARDAINDERTGSSWGQVGSKWDPAKFTLTPTSDGSAALNYTAFDEMEVPAGWTPMAGRVEPVEHVTAIKDIPSGHDETIGCPFTLLHKRMLEKWHWMISLAEERNLFVEAE